MRRLRLRIVGGVTSRTTLLDRLRAELRSVADPAKAPAMQRYMKSAMPYHGVAVPALRAVCRSVFADVEFAGRGAWERAVRAIWTRARYREEWYAAVELTGVRPARGFQTPEALPLYETMIVDAAWWDVVDDVAIHRVGPIVRSHPGPMKRAMRRWSRDANLWRRRTAILCQVGAKSETDLDFLYEVIEPSLGSGEFFLRKAIGWALRDYAWTDPDEVARYVRAREGELWPLSRREALKNVERGAVPRAGRGRAS